MRTAFFLGNCLFLITLTWLPTSNSGYSLVILALIVILSVALTSFLGFLASAGTRPVAERIFLVLYANNISNCSQSIVGFPCLFSDRALSLWNNNKSLNKKWMSSCFMDFKILFFTIVHDIIQFRLPSSIRAKTLRFFPIFCSPSIKPATTSGGCLLLVGIRVPYLKNIWIKTRPILNSCWFSKSFFDMKKSSWNS